MTTATLHLNALVTQGLLDEEFQAKLLNGQREVCLSQFKLTEQQRQVILSVKSDNMRDFVAQIYRLIRAEQPS